MRPDEVGALSKWYALMRKITGLTPQQMKWEVPYVAILLEMAAQSPLIPESRGFGL